MNTQQVIAYTTTVAGYVEHSADAPDLESIERGCRQLEAACEQLEREITNDNQ